MEFFTTAVNVPLFKGLSSRDLELIAAQSHIRTFKKGELLFYEGDDLPYWFYVVEGSLRAYKTSNDSHEISICTIDQGMAVNDMRLSGHQYQALTFGTIEAQEKGSMIGIKTSALPLLFTQIPEFTLRCFHTALISVENYQRAFYNGMVLDAMGKVAFMLAHDLEKFNRLKKQEIAALLNIQPETLSRLLGKLVRKEIIRTDGEIILLDTDAIKSLYN
ncbi:MAG: Crp/Fnr family transcriptional regulator [Sulfuricurvum sp.]|nr:Crp/Fnr family transcriptional regulator [Sulfuricurvum sp.]